MRIVFFMSTPAQVNFYKNILKILNNDNHSTIILARDYGETLDLLNELGYKYYVFANPSRGINRILSFPFDLVNALKFIKGKKIDLITGFEAYSVYVSKILGTSNFIFTDSEPYVNLLLGIQFFLYKPFTEAILTPETFLTNLGKKHLKIASLKELAYLHPNYFKPDKSVLELLGVDYSDSYAILRFNAFDAAHDLGVRGFTIDDKIELVRSLSKHLKVFISPEGRLPKSLLKYTLKIPKSYIHSAIYFAKLLVTDTQTMATEAAVLGTPVIRSNRFVGRRDMGNFIELEKKYGLMLNIKNPKKAIKKAVEIAKDDNIKRIWKARRERLLREKIDITSFMVWFIENYPNSIEQFKQNPEIQFKFK